MRSSKQVSKYFNIQKRRSRETPPLSCYPIGVRPLLIDTTRSQSLPRPGYSAQGVRNVKLWSDLCPVLYGVPRVIRHTERILWQLDDVSRVHHRRKREVQDSPSNRHAVYRLPL